MFCQHCGKEVDNEAVVCVHCGKMLKEIKQETPVNKDHNEPKTGMGVLMALFLGLIGLIIGLAIYPSNTIARKTFVKAWGITFGVSIGVIVLFYVIIFGIALAAI